MYRISLLFLLLIFNLNKVNSVYLDSFKLHTFSELNSLIEITDYYNLSIFMTSSKEIYKGIPPNKISTISSTQNFINLTSGVTYDENYILLVCADEYLVSKIEIETGNLTPLINYENITMSYYNCGSFTDKDYLYISMSHIITPKKTEILIKNNTNNETNYLTDLIYNSTDEFDYITFDDYEHQYLEHSVIKIKLNFDENNGPIIDEESEIIKYTLKYTTEYFYLLPKTSIFSCETINVKNVNEGNKVVCGYIEVNSGGRYYAKGIVISEDTDQVLQIKDLESKSSSIKLQKINSDSLVVITSLYVSVLSIEKIAGEYKLEQSQSNYFLKFESENDLYFYNNDFLFSSTGTSHEIYIRKNNSFNYFKFKDPLKNITKILGFYSEENEALVALYEYENNKLVYFTLENITFLYDFKAVPKINQVISNTETIFNIRELIKTPSEFKPLQLESLNYFINIKDRKKTYDKYILDNETQNLTIYGSDNDWVTFNFYYEGIKEQNPPKYISYGFFLKDCKFTIRTCQFKCGSCNESYEECSSGSCKQNFAMKRDDDNFECFSNDQNFLNYKYSNESNLFEKCYKSCKFCSEIDSKSSASSHNCLVCEDNYLKSYQYPGNCYYIPYPFNNSEHTKNAININDENYTRIDSCPNDKSYKIIETGECVSSCPTSAAYYTYKLNETFNISLQEENYMGLLYPLTPDKNIPKYSYHKGCYSKCPSYTKPNNQLNKCECLYAWNYVSNEDDILCYDNQDFCHSPDYYYHYDTKECKLYNCNSSYYKFNFECFKNSCPTGTQQDPQDSQNCIPLKPFCYINEYFKTICSDTLIPEYPFQFDDAKIYLKSCNYSLYYFNITTYLYNNICYKECPIETYLNISEGICSCKYYIHFLDETKTSYECLKENEKCSDIKKYNISYINQCVNTKEECTTLNYKIFNYECINECPENTQENDDGICLCKFYFLNVSNILTCFNDGQTCETLNFPIKKSNSLECFQTKEDCALNGYKYLNNICGDSCPENTEDKNNNGICLCKYNYINNTNQLNCLTQEDSCELQGYNYINLDTKECFTSLESCKNRKLKTFNDNCYSICPRNTKENISDTTSCICSDYFFTEENNHLICFEQSQNCETVPEHYSYSNIETKECFGSMQSCIAKGTLRICINNCINSNINKCDYSCDPRLDYFFNDICYKFYCPQGTKLDISNPDSRKCICEEGSKKDEAKGLVSCVYTFPEIHKHNKDNCPYFYNKKCVNKCPENTCLNPNSEDLKVCEDMRQTTKIYNEICIEGINEYIQKLVESSSDDEIIPIELPSGVILNAYPAEEDIDKLIEKYPFITYVDLGECKDNLKYVYKLPNDTRLYILGIDTPNLYGNSTINVFNYEIYLKNGTQLKDLSACNTTRIKISSNIKDLEASHFYKAIEFYEEGYDIYNKSNLFYQDYCAPAQDKGNDITLIDRAKYYYPTSSICNDGCIYNMVDFETKRFICKCNANLSEKVYVYENSESPEKKLKTEDEDQNYLEYFLSLMNYKIFLCINLFFEFKSFYYNAGFYIGLSVFIISIALMITFLIKGINHIKISLYKNIPTKEKLLEILNKRKEDKKDEVEIVKFRHNTSYQKERKKRKKKKIKDITIYDPKNSNSNNELFTVQIKTHSPPKKENIYKLYTYMENRTRPKDEDDDIEVEKYNRNETKYTYNIKKMRGSIDKISDNIFGNDDINAYEKSKKRSQTQRNKLNKLSEYNDYDDFDYNITYKSKNYNSIISKNKDYSESKNSFTHIFTLKDNDNNYIKNNYEESSIYNESLDRQNASNLKLKSPTIKPILKTFVPKNIIKLNNDNEKDNNNNDINSSKNNNIIQLKRKKRKKGNKTQRKSVKFKGVISKEKDSNIDLMNTKFSSNIINKDESLKIDFTFFHLIDRNDDEIDKRELNTVPYLQALRIDKRTKLETFLSIFANEIGFINIFYYKNAYSHFSLTISVYIFELLFDLVMNCFLYTDDVVSEKYHNDGNLSLLTSLSLSFISNIISSIGVYIIAKLTNYTELLEIIISTVKKKKKYFDNIIRFMKYIKIRLGIFYFLQIIFILLMIYYLFVFCAVYHQSQISITINYIVGALTSLAISTALSIIISILRVISLNCQLQRVYNISRYIYDRF